MQVWQLKSFNRAALLTNRRATQAGSVETRRPEPKLPYRLLEQKQVGSESIIQEIGDYHAG